MKRWLLVASALSIAGCSGATPVGKGSVAFTTWGEAYIEEGIPASAFEDGWSVKFSKFLLAIRNVRVADVQGAVAGKQPESLVFDMTKKGQKPVFRLDALEAKPWSHVSYEIAPPTASAKLGRDATEEDKRLLLATGASMHVEGTATRGAVTKSFSWTFVTATSFDRCKGDKDGKETEGVIVTDGGTDAIELTIHGDHLFYDHLQALNAKMRFDAIAKADADGDGTITLDELAEVRLATLPKEDGSYGTGAAGDVNTLKDFVTALSRTVGHFRGEGECFARDVR